MARVTVVAPQKVVVPPFIAEALNPGHHILTGGGKIKASDITADSETGKKFVPAGTYLGRDVGQAEWSVVTSTNLAAGWDEMWLTAYNVEDAAVNNDVDFLRDTCAIYHTNLPGWANLHATIQASIKAKYTCIKPAA